MYRWQQRDWLLKASVQLCDPSVELCVSKLVTQRYTEVTQRATENDKKEYYSLPSYISSVRKQISSPAHSIDPGLPGCIIGQNLCQWVGVIFDYL